MFFQSVQIGLLLILFVVNVQANDLKKCLYYERSTASIVLPSDESYDLHNYQFNIRKPIYPLGFIVVNSSNDVRIAVKCARKLNLSIATKCAGHSYEKFSFKDNQTWVIDVSNLKMIKINRKKMTADVGSGMVLQELTEILWKEGKLGAMVGSCASVGISGFSLGGGFGTNSRKYGLMVDRMEEIELVTANGDLLVASKNKNRELFWGLRGGGGGNFGIVTRFRIKLYDASFPIIVIKKNYSYKNFVKIFYKWQLWAALNPHPSINSLIRNINRTSFQFETIINERSDFKRHRLLNEIVIQFPNITEDDVIVTDYLNKLKIVSIPPYKPGIEMFFKAKSFYVSKILTLNEIRKFDFLLEQYPCQFVIEMYGGAINKPHPSETAFFHRRNHFLIDFEIMKRLKKDSDYESVIENAEKEVEWLGKLQENLSFMDNGYSYQNYIDLDLKDWKHRYYGYNYMRLWALKGAIDPSNFFNFAQSL